MVYSPWPLFIQKFLLLLLYVWYDCVSAFIISLLKINLLEPHKWQLRAYIYQARDILGLDSEGVSDAYAQISFQNVSAKTRVVYETLCPDWDQTLVFEDMPLYGSPNVIAENPPLVFIELFDKDKVVSFSQMTFSK